MILQYTDEKTFISEDIEFLEEHVEIANQLNEAFGTTPVIVRNDKKSLCFGINKGLSRLDREKGTNLYRVTIEKI